MNTLSKVITASVLGAAAYRYLSKRTSTPEAIDQRLQDRIRGRLRRMVADPDAIEVVVNAGDVSLRGDIQADEVDQVLTSVLAMPGVKHIHNRLAALEPAA